MSNSEATSQNPFLELDEDGRVLYQLKLSLVLYLDYAPGPNRARRVFDHYMKAYGSRVRWFQSTSWLGPPEPWDTEGQSRVVNQGLPHLQKQDDWGYAFTDGKSVDGNLFMFHGYRPVTEPGKASFFRFEWPWNDDPIRVLEFAEILTDTVPFLSGTAGFILSARPFEPDAYNQMRAICGRYWGIEAWNLDLTVKYVLFGYKCPSWLTLIGTRLLQRETYDTANLESLSTFAIRGKHGTIFRSRHHPEFIDRNRTEPYAGEQAIANALQSLQIDEHGDFGGDRWEGNTLDWLYRFSS